MSPKHCPPAPPLAQEFEPDAELARLAKALSHPARVTILRSLLEREECFCGELCRELQLAQSTVSQHLKALREAGLIHGSQDGLRVCYCVHHGALERVHHLLTELLAADRHHSPATPVG